MAIIGFIVLFVMLVWFTIGLPISYFCYKVLSGDSSLSLIEASIISIWLILCVFFCIKLISNSPFSITVII